MYANRQLFAAWLGPGQMSSQREKAFLSIVSHCSVPFNFITNKNVESWIDPNAPLHPAYSYLSAVHQSDYLRCYLMHKYGGGYTDIKTNLNNWNFFFDALELSNKLGAGYIEPSPNGVARVGGIKEKLLKENYQNLLGFCSFIFKSNTKFTQSWFDQVNNLLDRNLQELILNPAKHPQDHNGATFEGGHISQYPIPWTGLGGDIFHPLTLDFKDQFIHLDMAPSFQNYR